MSSLEERFPVLAGRAKTDRKAAKMLELLATVENAMCARGRKRTLMSNFFQSAAPVRRIMPK
jgi:hypothetical protein